MRTMHCASILPALLLAFFADSVHSQTISNQTVTAIDSRVTYIGDWTVQENGGHVFTSVAGSFALSFSGDAVYWYARKLYNGAVAAVTLDDDDVVFLDLSEGVGVNDTEAVEVLFGKDGLQTSSEHRFNVTWNGPGGNGVGAFLENFRIVFASDGSNSSSSSSTPTSSSASSSASSSGTHASSRNIGAIVGGTIGGIFGILLLVLAIFYFRRRRVRAAGAENMQSATPLFLYPDSNQGPPDNSVSSGPSMKQRQDRQFLSQGYGNRPYTLDSSGNPEASPQERAAPMAALPLRAQHSRFTFLPSWYRPRSESASQLQSSPQESYASGRDHSSYNVPATNSPSHFPFSSGSTDIQEVDPPPVYRG